MKKLILLLLFLQVGILYAEAKTPLTGTEILERIDKNYEAKTKVSEVTMIIKGARGIRTLTSKSWGEGTDKTFIHYLSPSRDKDTKMLKLGKELWIWTPSTDRIIKIAGHMLRQSMMGSDISYEDFMEDTKFSDFYNVTVEGEEKILERQCYILELTSKPDKTPAYHSRKIWVDKEWFLPLKEELFARGGKLLKKLTIDEVFRVKERWYPKKMTFKDVLMSGDGTQIIFDTLDFDVEIPDYIFSKASLKK